MDTLRPYQHDIVAEFAGVIADGKRRVLLVAPTAAGKTIIASEIIHSYTRRYRPVLVLTHRLEIVTQTSGKLAAREIGHGIIKAGFDPRPMAGVQVASVQTLWSRAMRSTAMPLPPADLLVIDECHHATARTWRKIIEAYPDAVLLGLTATPCRGDGRGLGGIFEVLIECPQVGDLVEQKYLVPTRVYAPVDPDLKGVRTVAGDYVESQLAERMDRAKLVGDIVTHWLKYGERRRTVAFAINVGHSIHIRDEFIKAGVRAEHLDGETPKDERDAILARLASGETELVTNCMVLTEGWDCPDLGCIVLARPTKKMGLYRQMIGRGLRPAQGKTDCIVLDHSGAVYRHGLVEDPVAWTLDPDERAEAPAHTARLNREAPKLLECSQCSAIRVGGQPCPACGFLPKRPAQAVDVIDGDLVPLGIRPGPMPIEERRSFHAQLRGLANERGHKPGWAAHKYREKFGDFPPWDWNRLPLETPQPSVRAWVRSRAIAWAYSRNNPQNHPGVAP